MSGKLAEYGRTAWNHKKKIIFFGGLAAWGFYYLNGLNNEQKLRTMYAKRAAAIGSRPVGGFDYIPPKFHVVIDFSDPTRHKNVHSFNKNVLPLLQLAGLNVIVKLAADETEVRSFTKEADLRNCSGVAIVGSKKYAEPGFLDEFFADNRPALAIFDPETKDDVDGMCKKAMQMIMFEIKR